MRSSDAVLVRFAQSAYLPRAWCSARRRPAGRAACFAFLLLAALVPAGGTMGAQPAPSAAQAQSREAEWARLHAGVEDAYMRGEFGEGIEIGRRALALAEAAFGPDDPKTLSSVDSLSLVYDAQGRHAEGEPLHIRAVESRTRVLGPDHQQTLESIGNFAISYGEQGRYREAEPLYLRALEGNERVLGPDHQQTLISLNNLAWLYKSQGRYAESEPLNVRALAASERTLGREHPDTLGSVNNLAFQYRRQGRYAEAEPLYLRALEANERTQGREHPQTLTTINNLADLYEAQGRGDEAEPLRTRALEASERRLGREHPDTLSLVNNLGNLYRDQGRYAEAEPLYARVLEASERTIGAEHPNTLNSVVNLAELYRSQSRHAEAEPLYVRALRAMERVLGPEHPNTLVATRRLADLYRAQGRLAEAEPLYVRALEVTDRVLGRDHPDTARAAAGLVTLRLSSPTGAGLAIAPARLAVSSLRSRRTAAAASAFAQAQREREQIQSADYFSLLADAAWASAAAGRESRSALAAEGFVALQDATAGTTNRAVIQMAVRRVADATGAGLGALVRERESLNDQWAVNSRAYSAALAGSDANAENMRRTLPAERTRIEARMDAIDATLRRDFPQYFALIRPEALDVAAAQAMLAPDEAVLMVVPTRFGTHVIGVSRTRIEWQRSAWTQDRINEAVRRLLWDVGAPVQVTPEQSAAWERPGQSGYAYDRRTAHALYRQVVAPVANILRGKRHVFVVAGGSLTSLPFGMLVMREPEGPDGDPAALRATGWFADAHALVQIPSIQSLQFLRRFGNPTGGPDGGAASFVGFGDPVLQGPPAARGRGRGAAGVRASALFGGGSTRSGGAVVNTRQLRLLSRLPGTATELENIRTALDAPPASLFLAGRATEANLRSADLSGVRILALATHGLTAGEVGGTTEPGLVFTPPATSSEQDDGYLTASEVAALRLDADWVILSACNTAAGDGSEGAPGLSGLARAFFYAGARNLLASHWPVRDDVAARLTVRTIQILREQPRLSRAEAFQRAMREIRNDRAHDSADDSWAHPNAWAPFTLIGDGAR